LAPKAQVLQFWLLPLHDLETLICRVNIAQQHAANKIPPAHTPHYISTLDPNTNHTAFFNHTTGEEKRSCIINITVNITIMMMQDQVRTRMQNMKIKEQKMTRK
jgi:hypothetical protein